MMKIDGSGAGLFVSNAMLPEWSRGTPQVVPTATPTPPSGPCNNKIYLPVIFHVGEHAGPLVPAHPESDGKWTIDVLAQCLECLPPEASSHFAAHDAQTRGGISLPRRRVGLRILLVTGRRRSGAHQVKFW